jgi:hypothetical protein
MKNVLLLLIALSALFGCSTTKLMNVSHTPIESPAPPEDNSNLSAIQKALSQREYIALSNVIKQTAIPAPILNHLQSGDKIRLIMAERSDNPYKDCYHIIENALTVSLMNKGIQVISVPATDLSKSNLIVDKYLFVTVYEAGIQYSTASNGKMRFAGFRFNLEVVNPTTSVILVSDDIFAVNSELLTDTEVEGINKIKLKSPNATMPLTMGSITANSELQAKVVKRISSVAVTFDFKLGFTKRIANIIDNNGIVVHSFTIPSSSDNLKQTQDYSNNYRYTWNCPLSSNSGIVNYYIVLYDSRNTEISRESFQFE